MRGFKVPVKIPLDTAQEMSFYDVKVPLDVRFYMACDKKFDPDNNKLHVVEKIDIDAKTVCARMIEMTQKKEIRSLIWQYEPTNDVYVLCRNPDEKEPYSFVDICNASYGTCEMPDLFFNQHLKHLDGCKIAQMLFTRTLETPPIQEPAKNEEEVVVIVPKKNKINESVKKQKTIKLVNPLPEALKPTDL
jgi:hypothetical protein